MKCLTSNVIRDMLYTRPDNVTRGAKMNYLQKLEIEANENGEYTHTAESGVKNGIEYDYTVSMTRELASDDFQAFDALVEAGILDDSDEANNLPVYAWRVEDPHDVKYYATSDDAKSAFESMIETYYENEIELLDETLQDDGGNYDWMIEGMEPGEFDLESLKAQVIEVTAVHKNWTRAGAKHVWEQFVQRYPMFVRQLISDLRGDEYRPDLVTISEAAEMLHGENTHVTRMRVQRAIRRGEFTEYIAEDETNPQHNTRLSRQEVQR